MIELNIIDGDLIAYRTSASAENEDVDIALQRADDLIQRLDFETNSAGNSVWLSGSVNYRYAIYPEYKGNRVDQPKPKWLQQVREHLVVHHGAKLTEGIEADDAMGIEQCKLNAMGTTTVISSLDKDMRMIPGNHYTWEISGPLKAGGQWVKPAEMVHISPNEGLFNFYWQLIMGDRTDNIFGYDGIARAKPPSFLLPKIEELRNLSFSDTANLDMYNYVRNMYDSVDRMHMNAKCLWIQRYEGDMWQPPETQENGQRDDSIVS